MTAVLVAVGAAVAVLALLAPSPVRTGRLVRPAQARGDDRGRGPRLLQVRGADRDRPVSVGARLLAGTSLGGTLAVVLGGVPGSVLGAAVGVGVVWWLRRQEPPAVRRRRARLAADLPHVVDLFAALLRSGQSPAAAAALVAVTAQGPAAEVLGGVAGRSAVGLDPYAVWRPVAEEQETSLLGAAMLRSLDSGSRVVDVVDRVAEELRREARAAATAQARTVGVRATAPLAACFLPALVLVGVVPFVASLVSPLLGRL